MEYANRLRNEGRSGIRQESQKSQLNKQFREVAEGAEGGLLSGSGKIERAKIITSRIYISTPIFLDHTTNR